MKLIPIAALPEPNSTQGYSPVTLGLDWPRLERLAIVISLTFFGSLLNGFFVSTFFVERTLQRLGNVYLACVGLADLIVSSVVMPAVAVVLLSSQWESVELCHALHFLINTSTYCYSLFFSLAGMETFYRICRPKEEYEAFMSIRVGGLSMVVFVSSFILAGIGVYMRQDYDYCQRRYLGNFFFKIFTSLTFHGIPLSITLICLFVALHKIKRRAKNRASYRRSQQFDNDYTLSVTHICVLLLYVCCWLPYLIVVNVKPTASDGAYYGTAWLGLVRAACSSCLYSIACQNFRHAFAQIFKYCCCKHSLSERVPRRRRQLQRRPRPREEIYVHLLQHAVAQHRARTALTRHHYTQYNYRRYQHQFQQYYT